MTDVIENKKAERLARKAADAETKREASEAARLAKFEAKFWAAPSGQARSTKLAGDKYFQIELPVDSTKHLPTMPGNIVLSAKKHGGQSRTLTDIENEGWDLIQTGFVFKETGQVSRDKFLSSGQQVSTTGETWGVYLFRATEAPARTDETWRAWA